MIVEERAMDVVDEQLVGARGEPWRVARVALSVEVVGLLLQLPEGMRIEGMLVDHPDGPRVVSVLVSHPELAVVEPGSKVPRRTVWIDMVDGRPVFDWGMGGGGE
jgi:hypothetical protein